MGNFICFARTEFLDRARNLGVYGNVYGSRPQARWSILRDLIAISPGSTIFFYEVGAKKLHGVFEATSRPFFDDTRVFGSSAETYPFRFAFAERIHFPTAVPDTEFIHLIDRKVVWSLRTLVKDPTAPFRSVVNITREESAALLRLLYKYNATAPPGGTTRAGPGPRVTQTIEAAELIGRGLRPSVPHMVDLTVLPITGVRKRRVQYEFALQAYLAHVLSAGTPQARELFGQYAQSLTEVPLSAAETHVMDVVLLYQSEPSQEPYLYSLIELKAKAVVSLQDLNQLLRYIRIFAEKKEVDIGSIEGIFVAPEFGDEALEYVRARSQIEVEKPLRLIRYELKADGHVGFPQLFPPS